MRDGIIEQDLRETIALDPRGDYWNVQVQVRDGVVHITGRVPTYRKLMDLHLLAAETPGVKLVVNKAVVDGERSRRRPAVVIG
ncbi:MAG: BON domain-containing protein [Armatimonadota bacterium]